MALRSKGGRPPGPGRGPRVDEEDARERVAVAAGVVHVDVVPVASGPHLQVPLRPAVEGPGEETWALASGDGQDESVPLKT